MAAAGFERNQASGRQFSPMAIIAVSLGTAALTLAAMPWVSLSLFPVFCFLWTFGLVPGVPAALVGAVAGVIAMRDFGAAAHRSRPMARIGLITSVLAVILGVLWLVYFFTGFTEDLRWRMEPFPSEGEETEKVFLIDVNCGGGDEHI